MQLPPPADSKLVISKSHGLSGLVHQEGTFCLQVTEYVTKVTKVMST